MVIGWNYPVRGREIQASKVFGEWVEMMGNWQNKGTIKSFTPVFMQAHGGHMNGFFLITGETSKLNDLYNTDEMRKAVTRAQLIVEGFSCVKAFTGDEIGKQMTMFTNNATELSK
jgi:hypothetical protein